MDIHHKLTSAKNRIPEQFLEGFYKDYNHTNLRNIRMAILLCILLYALFSFLDAWLLPDTLTELLIIRFFIIIPFSLLILLFTYTKLFTKFGQFALSALAIVGGFGINAMIIVSNTNNQDDYYIGLILVLMFSFTFLRLRFIYGTIAGVIIFLCYEGYLLLSHSDTITIITNSFFMFGALFIGILASFFYELLARREYVARKNLQDDKSAADKENKNLEQRVIERTEELENLNSTLKSAIKKAEENDKLKTAFLANMSHEIRTPMNGILGFSEILLEDEDYSPAEKRRYLEIINNNSIRLLNILNDVIDYAKIEAGIIEISPSWASVTSIIGQASELFEQDTKVPIIQKVEDPELKIFSDCTKVTQILTNLLGNAIKFTSEGSIEIGCESITNEEIRFYVKDTGIGIPEEKQEAIFERFVQGAVPNDQINIGLGLGLPIILAYAKKLNGRIELQSEPNVGSEFSLFLPLRYLSS